MKTELDKYEISMFIYWEKWALEDHSLTIMVSKLQAAETNFLFNLACDKFDDFGTVFWTKVYNLIEELLIEKGHTCW